MWPRGWWDAEGFMVSGLRRLRVRRERYKPCHDQTKLVLAQENCWGSWLSLSHDKGGVGSFWNCAVRANYQGKYKLRGLQKTDGFRLTGLPGTLMWCVSNSCLVHTSGIFISSCASSFGWWCCSVWGLFPCFPLRKVRIRSFGSVVLGWRWPKFVGLQCTQNLLNLNCLAITSYFDGLYGFRIRGDYLVFILIKPIVLELIELLVVAVNLLLKSIKSFFKYAHLQGEIIKICVATVGSASGVGPCSNAWRRSSRLVVLELLNVLLDTRWRFMCSSSTWCVSCRSRDSSGDSMAGCVRWSDGRKVELQN